MWKVFIIWFVWNSGKVKLKYGKKKEKEGKGKGKEKQKQSGGLLEGQLTEKDHLEDWGTAGMPEILIVCSSSSRGLEMFYILIRVYSFLSCTFKICTLQHAFKNVYNYYNWRG